MTFPATKRWLHAGSAPLSKNPSSVHPMAVLRQGAAIVALGATLGMFLTDSVPAHAQQQGQGMQAGDQTTNVIAQQQVRIEELERMVQSLTGKVEEAQFKNRQLAQKLDQLMKDVDFRFKQLEGGGSSSVLPQGTSPAAAGAQQATPVDGAGSVPPKQSAGAVGQTAGVKPPAGVLGYMASDHKDGAAATPQPGVAEGAASGGSVLPEGTPTEQYNYAFGLLRKNDYAHAEQAFEEFLKLHKDHELAGNAQYWLGETFYVRGDYQKAMVAFYDGYKNYHNSTKGPDNLLKLGLTAAQLGQTKQACAALAKVETDFSHVSDMLKRRAQVERQRLSCK